jgi:hypothetical protein
MAKKRQNENTQMVPIGAVLIHACQVTVVSFGQKKTLEERGSRYVLGRSHSTPLMSQSPSHAPKPSQVPQRFH